MLLKGKDVIGNAQLHATGKWPNILPTSGDGRLAPSGPRRVASASVASTNKVDNVAPPSRWHVPAGCRRYEKARCPAISWTLD
jgi:hypothetical protein